MTILILGAQSQIKTWKIATKWGPKPTCVQKLTKIAAMSSTTKGWSESMEKELSQTERNKVPGCRSVVLRTRYQQHRQYPEGRKKNSSSGMWRKQTYQHVCLTDLTPRFQIYTSKVNDVSAIFVENITFLFPLGVGENTRSCKSRKNRTIWLKVQQILT